MPTRDTLSKKQLHDLARAGAETTIQRLRAEIAAIERAFPGAGQGKHATAAEMPTSTAKRSRGMSAAAKKAVSLRMKRYWAARKKAEKKGK